MTTVPRHPTDESTAWEEIEDLSPQVIMYLDHVGKNAAALKNLQQTTLMLTQWRTVVDPAAEQPETWEDLRIAAQAATAVFTAADTGEGRPVETVVAKPVRFAATGPVSAANPGAWLNAAWLAVIDRNDALIQRLCAVSVETLRAAGTEHDAYLEPWVETVRTFLAHREVTPELFGAVMDGTDPDNARITPPRVMLQLVYPPIRAFYHLLRRDQAQFTAALTEAVRQHRTFWSADGLADSPDGFLALAPLAIAVLARSAGMSTDIESEYLPRNFLTGIRPAGE
ncbi:immunity 49 family protein [Amycolatopsis cynarae]|uniref:Immunity 49 family protein n=1 Tax=Amycolatopsis cynarae TaxID=2995223 RepID=A0ABY7B6S2_9PSEU|nr:immunity 49 family protein [Amycolatopsis sp. HUAS 11-8]WAL67851.1 immunity 49 family protein [Amycolatopsis sp. HUAS 11-8]